MQSYHLERLKNSPEVSERADGVDMSGRASESNMLAGPMVARIGDDQPFVIGVLQLIEKKRSEDAGKGGLFCDSFTEQDQRFFKSMLQILGLAAYRTMQLQARAGDSDVDIHVAKLLQ